jgi:hypothetical protein
VMSIGVLNVCLKVGSSPLATWRFGMDQGHAG